MRGHLRSRLGYVVTLHFISNENFANKFDSWLAGLILWMSDWGRVTCQGPRPGPPGFEGDVTFRREADR